MTAATLNGRSIKHEPNQDARDGIKFDGLKLDQLVEEFDDFVDHNLSEDDKITLSYYLNEFETRTCDLSDLLANVSSNLLIKLSNPLMKFKLLNYIRLLYLEHGYNTNRFKQNSTHKEPIENQDDDDDDDGQRKLDLRLFNALARRYLVASQLDDSESPSRVTGTTNATNGKLTIGDCVEDERVTCSNFALWSSYSLAAPLTRLRKLGAVGGVDLEPPTNRQRLATTSLPVEELNYSLNKDHRDLNGRQYQSRATSQSGDRPETNRYSNRETITTATTAATAAEGKLLLPELPAANSFPLVVQQKSSFKSWKRNLLEGNGDDHGDDQNEVVERKEVELSWAHSHMADAGDRSPFNLQQQLPLLVADLATSTTATSKASNEDDNLTAATTTTNLRLERPSGRAIDGYNSPSFNYSSNNQHNSNRNHKSNPEKINYLREKLERTLQQQDYRRLSHQIHQEQRRRNSHSFAGELDYYYQVEVGGGAPSPALTSSGRIPSRAASAKGLYLRNEIPTIDRGTLLELPPNSRCDLGLLSPPDWLKSSLLQHQQQQLLRLHQPQDLDQSHQMNHLLDAGRPPLTLGGGHTKLENSYRDYRGKLGVDVERAASSLLSSSSLGLRRGAVRRRRRSFGHMEIIAPTVEPMSASASSSLELTGDFGFRRRRGSFGDLLRQSAEEERNAYSDFIASPESYLRCFETRRGCTLDYSDSTTRLLAEDPSDNDVDVANNNNYNEYEVQEFRHPEAEMMTIEGYRPATPSMSRGSGSGSGGNTTGNYELLGYNTEPQVHDLESEELPLLWPQDTNGRSSNNNYHHIEQHHNSVLPRRSSVSISSTSSPLLLASLPESISSFNAPPRHLNYATTRSSNSNLAQESYWIPPAPPSHRIVHQHQQEQHQRDTDLLTPRHRLDCHRPAVFGGEKNQQPQRPEQQQQHQEQVVAQQSLVEATQAMGQHQQWPWQVASFHLANGGGCGGGSVGPMGTLNQFNQLNYPQSRQQQQQRACGSCSSGGGDQNAQSDSHFCQPSIPEMLNPQPQLQPYPMATVGPATITQPFINSTPSEASPNSCRCCSVPQPQQLPHYNQNQNQHQWQQNWQSYYTDQWSPIGDGNQLGQQEREQQHCDYPFGSQRQSHNQGQWPGSHCSGLGGSGFGGTHASRHQQQDYSASSPLTSGQRAHGQGKHRSGAGGSRHKSSRRHHNEAHEQRTERGYMNGQIGEVNQDDDDDDEPISLVPVQARGRLTMTVAEQVSFVFISYCYSYAYYILSRYL